MTIDRLAIGLFLILSMAIIPVQVGFTKTPKLHILVVSSYHKEYLWSQETNSGVIKGLLDFGYLENKQQGEIYTSKDYVESSNAVVKKLWMDTKHKNKKIDIEQTIARIIREIEAFQPDVILLGDDNATNYIGNQYVDTETPIVFWGVNGHPLKYDLVDSIEIPGHNVTGVYQAGYLKEGIAWLQKLIPDIKRIAVLSDDSPSGRSKAKELTRFAKQGKLPVTIVETVVTNSVETWKLKALELQDKSDAFFVLNHNTLKHADGDPVDQLEIGAWYLRNINKPDVAHEKQFVEEGLLCAVDDSGFKQGYEAVKIAWRILHQGENPAEIAVYAPERGAFVVNLARAKMLGILNRVEGNPLVEQTVQSALALEKHR